MNKNLIFPVLTKFVNTKSLVTFMKSAAKFNQSGPGATANVGNGDDIIPVTEGMAVSQ
ncbi:MAG: hypothetical protein M3P08_04395 [Thermoproteota archaeon]|nr:hypothetical protein [Thermoproteota archaeon]